MLIVKIATLFVLSLFTAVVGLPPLASADRIDIEKIDKHIEKYNAHSDHEKKIKDNKYEGTSEKVKNGGPGTFKYEGTTLTQNGSVQGPVHSVPEPSTLLLLGVAFVVFAVWHQRSRKGMAA